MSPVPQPGELISVVSGRNLYAERMNNYSVQAAIGEVIDNSIEANSKNIKIRFKWSKGLSQRKPRPSIIAIGDDGDGMDSNGKDSTLQLCLRLGYSKRFNSRKGLGRFGVGMTKGAINMCRHIEVYSREHQGTWRYVLLDMDNPDTEGNPGTTPVTEKPLPDEYKDLVGDKGTLIIWSNIDGIDRNFEINANQGKSSGKVRDNTGLKQWMERSYRKFIGDKIIENGKIIDNPNQISIELDDGKSNEKLIAFDPLYFIPNPRRPNDETATMDNDWELKFAVSDIDKPENPPKEGIITIRLTLTPESWRKLPKHGNDTDARSRYIPDNEGFSILRKGREVFFGKIDNWTPIISDFDRFWSCEIDFDPVLDYQFKVSNVKIGAKPLLELREELQKEITPTLGQKFRKTIRGVWAAGKSGTVKPEPQPPLPPDVFPPPEPVSPTPEEEAEQTVTQELLTRIMDPASPGILIEHKKDGDPDDPIFEIKPLGGKRVQYLNLNHAFWQHVFDRIEKIKTLSQSKGNSDKIIEEVDHLKEDVDRFLISMAKAMKDLSGTDTSSWPTMEAAFENFIFVLSQTLRFIYRDSSATDSIESNETTD